MLTKKKRQDLIDRIRVIAGSELHYIINVKKEFTGREMSMELGIDPSRLSQVMSATPKHMSETTLRKLVGGGIVKVKELTSKLTLTPEEEDYLRKFRAYEDRKLIDPIDKLSEFGYDPIRILNKLLALAKKGTDVDQTLDNMLRMIK